VGGGEYDGGALTEGARALELVGSAQERRVYTQQERSLKAARPAGQTTAGRLPSVTSVFIAVWGLRMGASCRSTHLPFFASARVILKQGSQRRCSSLISIHEDLLPHQTAITMALHDHESMT
jgi:hypothetical protein